jgi:O-antigen biosynthesis protein
MASEAPPDGLDPIPLALEEARLDTEGTLHVRGWALAWRRVQSVEVLLGETSLGFADTMLSRADVGMVHDAYPDAALAGFALTLRVDAPDSDAADFGAPVFGAAQVAVIVTDQAGATRRAELPLAGPGAKAAPQPMLAVLEEARVTELGVLRVRGWAASLSPVEHVRVFLDGEPIGAAEQNLPREDVGAAHPDYPDAARSGFLFQQVLEHDAPAGLPVRVEVAALGGITRELTDVLSVAPVIRRRGRTGAPIQFHCDALSLAADGTLFVRGWALCEGGTERIEIDLGAERLGVADLAQERADVGNAFPHVPGARRAGFRFRGRAAGPLEGEQVVTLTVHSKDGESKSAPLPVLVGGAGGGASSSAFRGSTAGIRCYLDTPQHRDGEFLEPVRGFLSLNGWALSRAGIVSVEVFVDGRSQGEAHRGIRREDLHAAVGEDDALRAGFAMLIPPHALKRGRHDIRVVVRDGAGEVEQIAVTAECEPVVEGPGPWTVRRKLTEAEAALQRAVIAACGVRPHVTVLLPCKRAPATLATELRATLESLRMQAWPDWDVVIATPARTKSPGSLLEGLDDIAARAGVVPVAAATKLATLASRGPRALLVTLMPGDVLGEDALLEIAAEAALSPDADLLYADERRIDPTDGAKRALFKPDFAPELLLAMNYVGRPLAVATELLARIDVTLGESLARGSYDFVLRLTEAAHRVVHISKVLCERGATDDDSPTQEQAALACALERRGVCGTVAGGFSRGTWRIERPTREAPLVSVIMPTAGSRGLVRTAIESIQAHTRYPAIEIVVVDNIPDDAPDADALRGWLDDAADVVVRIEEPFNWSRFNNLATDAAGGDLLLFLNDDIDVREPGWLAALVTQATRPDVGAVGPLLLYPDGTVQHAGMFLSGEIGRHAFRHATGDTAGPFGLARVQREVIAVTGACLLTRRDVFETLGGFDERHDVVNNDLDYCLRVREAGKPVLFVPEARLVHHEMASRAALPDAHDSAGFRTRWADLLARGDPYFNVNLAADAEEYVPEPEPISALHVGHPLIAREAVRRVLAVKVDHIGDFIAAFPALRRLKDIFPNAELTVLAASASAALAGLEPAIDRLLTFDFFHARSQSGRRALSKQEFANLEDMLAPHRFDLALDLRRQPETRVLLQHSGARWLAGFDRDNDMRFLDIAVPWEGDIARTHKRAHVSDALVAFVDVVARACEPDRRMLHLVWASTDAARAQAVQLAGIVVPAGAPLVAIHAGAGAENKQWPAGNFAALIDLLTREEDARVLLLGGPDDAALSEAIRARVSRPGAVASTAGRVALRDLPDLLRGCDLFVGNDSGPKHLAAALGVPTIGIHGGSVDPVEWGPLGPAAVAIRRETTCSPCYLALASDCHRRLACLHGIRVGDVWRVVRGMLALRRARAKEARAC